MWSLFKKVRKSERFAMLVILFSKLRSTSRKFHSTSLLNPSLSFSRDGTNTGSCRKFSSIGPASSEGRRYRSASVQSEKGESDSTFHLELLGIHWDRSRNISRCTVERVSY